MDADAESNGLVGTESSGPAGVEPTGPVGAGSRGPTGAEPTGPVGAGSRGPAGAESTGPVGAGASGSTVAGSSGSSGADPSGSRVEGDVLRSVSGSASWADIAAAELAPGNVSRRGAFPVPLPHGGRVARHNTVVLHTQAFKDITVREVMNALLKCTSQESVKCLQQVPGPRYRVTFRSVDLKKSFLDQEFWLRGEKVLAQEMETAVLSVKLLYVPNEITNHTVALALGTFGKVLQVDREMYQDWPGIESGVRIVKMSDLTEGVPRKFFIGPYPVESRYRGQVPQCGRCGQFGHRVATCVNGVKCFRCGQEGHVQRSCFKCFSCGQFGHVRANCPDAVGSHLRRVEPPRVNMTAGASVHRDIVNGPIPSHSSAKQVRSFAGPLSSEVDTMAATCDHERPNGDIALLSSQSNGQSAASARSDDNGQLNTQTIAASPLSGVPEDATSSSRHSSRFAVLDDAMRRESSDDTDGEDGEDDESQMVECCEEANKRKTAPADKLTAAAVRLNRKRKKRGKGKKL